jgi:hypothetical protein
VRASAGASDVTVSKLRFPVNGRVQFVGTASVKFVDTPRAADAANDSTNGTTTTTTTTNSTTPVAQWLDKTGIESDVKCGANWYVKGTSSNPEFAIPCHFDVAVFQSVCCCCWVCMGTTDL